MKKQIKKFISSIFPKGEVKEKIKLLFYTIFKTKDASFKLINNIGKIKYKTTFKKVTLITNEALYTIVPDFNFYQNFYKVKKEDVVIDAGANCGHLSIYFSKLVGNQGKIYAFEPDKYNILRIEENIKLNNDLTGNIKIEDLLLWDENKFVDFYEAGTVGSSAVWMPDNDKCVKKEAITIDTWVAKNNIQKLDFIKMDIEGAEIEALDGCIETIKKLKPNFAIASYHYVNGEQTYIKLEKFFEQNNYSYKTVWFTRHEIITFAGPSINT